MVATTGPGRSRGRLEVSFEKEALMTVTRPQDTRVRSRAAPPPGRKAGYLVAAVVNGVLLYVVNNLLEWEWPPFLTEDFSFMLTILNVSLVASLVVNVAWIVADPIWFRSPAQIGLNVISFVVAIRTWQVFPFDFTPYDFPWGTLFRVGLAVGMFGIVAASIAELVKLARWGLAEG
jgi:hypothetical protein